MRIYLNSRLYTAAFNEGWLKQLAVFSILSKKYDSKVIWFKPKFKTKKIEEIAENIGVSKNTLRKHLSILEEKKLVRIERNAIKLTSNREINEQYKSTKTVFTDKLSSVKIALESLRSLVLRTNCLRQQKSIIKKEHLDRKESKGGTKINKNITLSNNKIALTLGYKSIKSVKNFKKFCRDNNIMNSERNLELYLKGIKWDMYSELKREGALPKGCTYQKGNIYKEGANLIRF